MTQKYIKYTDKKIKCMEKKFFEILDNDPSILMLYRLVQKAYGRTMNVHDLGKLAKRNEMFGVIWEDIKGELEARLAERALNRKTDTGMTKFVLSHNYGWSEKSEVTNISAMEVLPDFGDDE